ncbi:MAG: exodeoxyribonuclease VII small subunit [Bacteroidetes bacterium HGW-Bacteroidetes-19]|nr:MAG: exodeoxyribonuclease VII small subunit [Bacteroidetes bacterium HGW-Bacteroidetes-20]PKP28576.1 MAG: exodeoxyribonuclease VII small subunit [Bacteroidetes bacterium HGW-Bacteroidetes-19]
MKKPDTYTEAFEELQSIVKKMENAEISVDELSTMIQRASLLITICKDKLTKTEEEVSKLLEEL